MMKLQDPKILLIEDKDPDLLQIEKLIQSFDLEAFDNLRLLKSNFVKMVQTIELLMEKNLKKLSLLVTMSLLM